MKALVVVLCVFVLSGCDRLPEVQRQANLACSKDAMPEYCIEGVSIVFSQIMDGKTACQISENAKEQCEKHHYENMTEETAACKRGVDIVDALFAAEDEPIIVW